MKVLYSVLFVISIALISACSSEQAEVVNKSTQGQKLNDDNVFKGYETALDKAKGIEQSIQDTADLRREEMQEGEY